jgi:uncharacterized membrane protein YdjX (TVP38/TMEM64 family)
LLSRGTVRPPGSGADDVGVSTSIWLRAALLGLLLAVGAVVAATVDLPDVAALRSWLAAAGGVGWVAMVLGLGVVLLAPVPRSVVSVLIGLVAGFWTGLAVALAGGLLGALAAFALSRTLGRPAVARFAGRRLARVDRLSVDRGFAAVLTGRLVPVVPFVVLSYGAGLTTVRPVSYASATALGLVPSTVLQVGIGASAGAIVAGATTVTVVLLVVLLGVAAASGLVWWRRRVRSDPMLPVEAAAG